MLHSFEIKLFRRLPLVSYSVGVIVIFVAQLNGIY